MPKVFITRPIPDNGIKLLQEKGYYEVVVNEAARDRVATKEEMLRGAHGAHALLSVLTEKIDAESTWHFAGTVSDEASKQVQEAWRMSNSDNKGLDTVARLLAANRVKQLDVWLSKNNDQLRQIKANFVRPLSNGNEFDFATLEISLTDYGKVVTIDRPAEELAVKPDVFAKLFGSGEIEEIGAE